MIDTERRIKRVTQINTLDLNSESKRYMTQNDDIEGVRLDMNDCLSDSENSITKINDDESEYK